MILMLIFMEQKLEHLLYLKVQQSPVWDQCEKQPVAVTVLDKGDALAMAAVCPHLL